MDRQKGTENLSACLIIDNITENSILDSIQFDVSRSIDLFREEEQVSLISSEQEPFTLRYLEIYSNAQRDVISPDAKVAMPCPSALSCHAQYVRVATHTHRW